MNSNEALSKQCSNNVFTEQQLDILFSANHVCGLTTISMLRNSKNIDLAELCNEFLLKHIGWYVNIPQFSGYEEDNTDLMEYMNDTILVSETIQGILN